MNELLYDNQTLTDYLLGALPEIEAEKFDELDFTDEDFAAQLKSVENDLVDAYVNGELDHSTREKFQAHYLISPLRREKVAFAETFQNFARRNLSAQTANSEISETVSKSWFTDFFSRLNIFSAPQPALRWGISALGLLLILAAGFWLINKYSQFSEKQIIAQRETSKENPEPGVLPAANQNLQTAQTQANSEENIFPTQPPKKLPTSKSPPEKIPSIQPPAPIVASFVLALPLRGAGQIQNISLPKNAFAAQMTLPLETAEFPFYRVALIDSSGKNYWTSGKLKVKSSGGNTALDVRFPAKLLKSQIYSLEVSGVNAAGEAEIISNYPFRVVLR